MHEVIPCSVFILEQLLKRVGWICRSQAHWDRCSREAWVSFTETKVRGMGFLIRISGTACVHALLSVCCQVCVWFSPAFRQRHLFFFCLLVVWFCALQCSKNVQIYIGEKDISCTHYIVWTQRSCIVYMLHNFFKDACVKEREREKPPYKALKINKHQTQFTPNMQATYTCKWTPPAKKLD